MSISTGQGLNLGAPEYEAELLTTLAHYFQSKLNFMYVYTFLCTHTRVCHDCGKLACKLILWAFLIYEKLTTHHITT